MTRNLFQMMRICSAVVLRYLEADVERLCPQKYLFCLLDAAATGAACCLLLGTTELVVPVRFYSPL